MPLYSVDNGGQITCLVWLGGQANDDLQPIYFGTGHNLVIIYWHSRTDVSYTGHRKKPLTLITWLFRPYAWISRNLSVQIKRPCLIHIIQFHPLCQSSRPYCTLWVRKALSNYHWSKHHKVASKIEMMMKLWMNHVHADKVKFYQDY